MNGVALAPDEIQNRQHHSAPTGARMALILLLAINLFNYIDRYVLAAVFPNIRRDLIATNDPNADLKLGALATAFMVTYMVLSPVFGWLGDRISRWWLIGIGVILWSLASGASGLAATFAVLLLTRCFVGVGEAAYGPVAPTVIADLYPVEHRGGVLAWFYCAIPVGSALGYALGGQVAGLSEHSWRWAFYLVVPPGILLGLWCWLMREPVRGQADRASEQESEPGFVESGEEPYKKNASSHWRDCLSLLRIPSYVLNTLGMTAMTFAFGGLAVWMPTYLVDERHVTSLHGVDPQTIFGGLTALAGLTGTLAGGLTGDWLRKRFSGSYFLVSGITMLIGFPSVLLVLWTPFPWNWLVIFGTVFCLFFNTGPTNTILANVTHPSIRATAFAINIFTIHILGDVISPPIIGFVRDQTHSLAAGFALVSVMILLGGILWLCGARFLEQDTRLAPTRLRHH